ncbi:hypothetical protein JOQ06_024367, partial [Pogonophryne albipinna]
MQDVSSKLKLFQTLSAPLMYGGFLLLVCGFLRHRYLRELDFDNVYLSAQFAELDRQVTCGGGASVLPITLSLQLSAREQRAMFRGVASVLKHLVMGGLLVALDFLVFWTLDQVNHQVKGDVVARAPVTVALQVSGSGYASDIFRDLVASFDVLQRGNVTVLSRKCLQPPAEPDHANCFLLGFLLGLALVVSVFGGFMQRCRRLERVWFVRQQILDQRRMEGRALRRLPGGAHLSHLLGGSAVSCLSCGEELRQDEDNMAACP